MRNEIRTVLALSLGLAVAPTTVAFADAAANDAVGAKVAESTSVVSPPVGAALGELKAVEVRALQTALQKTGHYQGALDGVAGPATQAALSAFQRAQVSDGSVVDPTTQKALGLQLARLEDMSSAAPAMAGGEKPGVQAEPQGEKQVEQTPVEATATKQSAPPAPAPSVAVADESKSAAIAVSPEPELPREFALAALSRAQLQAFQAKLRTLGHYSGPLDGLDGPRTRQAFRDFFNHQLGLMTNQFRITREGALALGVDLTPAAAQSGHKPVAVANGDGPVVADSRGVASPPAPRAVSAE